MSAVAVILIAGGAWLCYYAVRTRSTVHPITHAKAELQKLRGTGGIVGNAGAPATDAAALEAQGGL